MSEQFLLIERLGNRGEGVARTERGLVFVPYALPGETVRVETEGERGRLVDIVAPSPDRVPAFCPHYTACGGCAVQTLAPGLYAQWKRGLVEAALRNAGLGLEVAPLVDAHGEGRRRATFHARIEGGVARVGFMQARSHALVEIDACPLLAPGLAEAPKVAEALARALVTRAKPLDIVVTGTREGLDVDIRGAGALEEGESRALLELAESLDLARLANHGRLVALRRPPRFAVGKALVVPPPGAFLQATGAGEQAIAALVEDATADARRIADLFCGVGAFALRLAGRAKVLAADSDAPAIEALSRAWRLTDGLRPVETQVRDLFRRPLGPDELSAFDAVVFDPPRAGAKAQAEAIAKSTLRKAVAVSCNAQSFARDAEILLNGGFAARTVTPIDQFRGSPHVEIVAVFERTTKPGAKRRLLSR
jgi:23S rRNA (uracil1939-C5)-methyltransferase